VKNTSRIALAVALHTKWKRRNSRLDADKGGIACEAR
jgi:hypothetical protein